MSQDRIFVFKIFFLVVISIIAAKLFYIQVIDDKYERWSTNNSVRVTEIVASRGEILDRNGMLLAQSKESYDLYVTPIELKKFDTTLVCNILDISKHHFDSVLTKCRKYSIRKPSLLYSQLTHKQKLLVEEMDISGLTPIYKSVRSYPYKVAGNILGYVSSVSRANMANDDYYGMNDVIGKTGLESTYELLLRGVKGMRYQSVNVYGGLEEGYDNGEKDIEPISGSTLTTTIDLPIQKLGEELLKDKIGAIVAIEPSTGEILAMISSPTYDPGMLIGKERTSNYRKLALESRKPLFNRALKGSYPPGSTFKIAVGLAALEENIVTMDSYYYCFNGFAYGGRVLGCHVHPSPLSMEYAIQTSCNAYFCNAFVDMLQNSKYGSVSNAFEVWGEVIRSFGFGDALGVDMLGEANGFIPNSDYYNKVYNGRWSPYTILSICIGQGEILVSPIQLANFGALIANRGFYHTPHFLKKINGEPYVYDGFSAKHSVSTSSESIEKFVSAMWKGVNVEGSGLVAKVDGLDICGKTGTAENGFGKDHSTFLAFAPKDNPKIAIGVYVENGGFGATVAAPVASLMIEQYLTDTITRPDLYDRIINTKIEYPHYDAK